MGKKRKQNSRQRRRNQQVALHQPNAMVSPEDMAKVRHLRAQLEAEMDIIQNSPPPVPAPPARHVYKREIRKDDFDNPESSWILVSCENCEFLLYSRAGELHQKMDTVSPYCALPFGTAAEAERLMKNWEEAVSKAYNEMFPGEGTTGEVEVFDDSHCIGT